MLNSIIRLRAPDSGGAAGSTGNGAAGGTSGTEGAPSGTATPPSGTATPPPDAAANAPSFDDLLKDPAYKAEYDKRNQAAADAAKAEAERVAKLTAEERATEDRRKFESDRAAFDHERLENEATKQLAQMGLPVEFAPQLVGKDATVTLANVQTFGKAFTAAVEKGVNDRIKGAAPKAGSTGAASTTGADGKAKSAVLAAVTDNQFKR